MNKTALMAIWGLALILGGCSPDRPPVTMVSPVPAVDNTNPEPVPTPVSDASPTPPTENTIAYTGAKTKAPMSLDISETFTEVEDADEKLFSAESAKFLLKSDNRDFNPPDTVYQRKAGKDDNGVVMEVRWPSIADAPQKEENLKKYLAKTCLLELDNPQLKELAQKACSEKAEDAVRAEQCRKFVNEYIITKQMPYGRNSAAFVAKNRIGDCKNHAVLLVALLRLNGIPAREVTGLMVIRQRSVNGKTKYIAGYHVWAEAYIKDRWMSFDAILPVELKSIPSHIALSNDDLSTFISMDTMSVMSTISNLKIKLLETK